MALVLNPTLPAAPNPPNTTVDKYPDAYNHHKYLLLQINQCTNISHLKQLHAHTLRTTYPSHPQTLLLYSRILHSSSLLNLAYAFRVFDHQIENPNSFSWNALIRACAHNVKLKQQAILVFKKMLEVGDVGPDKHTFPFVLKACAYLFALSEGKQVHAQVFKLGFESDVYVNNSLIHFYASCGCFEFVKKVFDKMPERSIVSWNVMIDALVQFADFDYALTLFGEMQSFFEPDGYTLQSVISACASLGALSMGMWVHTCMLRNCDAEFVTDVLINNSLVDMYCKCGALDMAVQVFERMSKRDVNSWNAMILGFAMHGKAEEALEYFSRLVETQRFPPNSVTFVGVLCACNHRGLVKRGHNYFNTMIEKYKIKPVLEHYGCLVDIYARAGLIEEALNLVSTMPMKPDAVIWMSLLDACCKKNAGIEFSEDMARRLIETAGGNCSGLYVLLSRIYASADRWIDVGLIRKLMTDNGVTKEPGCSSIELNGVTHEFFSGDTSHPQIEEVYRFLDVADER
ncbi:hypothetical protein ACFE04_024274 [Oxalis oulophora]